MPRLPQPGSDQGEWGEILNDFLSQAHNADGSLKDIPQSKVTGLAASLSAKADTSDIPTTPAQVGAEPAGLSEETKAELEGTIATQLSGTPLRALTAKAAQIASGTTARAKWVTMFDSMAQAKAQHFLPRLARIFGGGGDQWSVVGTGAPATYGGSTINASSGVTQVTNDYGVWPSGFTFSLGTGATQTWGRGGVGAVCNSIKLYYVIAPSAGTFKVQVDGVDAVGFTNVSADGAAGLGVITLTPALGQHTLTIVNLTGTVKVLFPVFENTSVSGLVVLNVSQGGAPLDTATNTPAALSRFGAFLADQQVDVISFEAKEASSYYATALGKLLTAIRAAVPAADFLGIGSTPVVANDADQVTQNSQLRAACAAFGGVYWDGYTPVVNYATMVAYGWQGDGTHPDDKAQMFLAGKLMDDLGIADFVGLPEPRSIASTIARVRDRIRLGNEDVPVLDIIQSVLDVSLKQGRVLNFTKADGTVYAAFDSRDNSGNPSSLPSAVGVGVGKAGLVAPSASLLAARRLASGNMNGQADFQARSIVKQTASITVSAVSGAVTLDLNTGSAFTITMDANITSLTMTNAVAQGQEVTVHFVQDATGGRTIAGVNNIIRPAGGTFALTATAGKIDTYEFVIGPGSTLQEMGRALNK